MCGVSGIAFSSRSGRAVEEAVLVRMRDVLWHRGPDDGGCFIEGPVGLAHRRLSIVDVSCGHQPMGNEDGAVQIVYNGEIYNHADHRAMLEGHGHRFSTRSDTETIIHLYEQFGARCVDYLRGMFAFAIWNRRSKELFIARDRLGVKPLYYSLLADGTLVFGSEIKAILASGLVKAEMNRAALPDFLANRATMDNQTLFAGVMRLPAGHTLTWNDGKVRIEKFWDVAPAAVAASRSVAEYVDEWRELFTTSVRLRLMADVPLGMFLSGGIDSSAIAAVMSKMVKDPIKTFSVAFRVPEANELSYARTVAQAFGTDHHEVLIDPQQFIDALPHLVWHEDEPIAHSASVPLYFVSQLAQRHVKVVLTGEGADELLGGYYRYRTTRFNLQAAQLYHRWSGAGSRRFVQGFLSRVAPAKLQRKLTRTFLWREPTIDSIYFDNFSVFSRERQADLLAPELRSEVSIDNAFASMRGYFDAYPEASLLQRMLYSDLKTYLHELLMKQDQMSMAASIESRVPFLDHKLVEFSTALPDELKLHGLTTKRVLREAMKGLLPDEILTRRKMGFPVPLARWLRTDFQPMVQEHLLSARALERGLFQPEAVRALVAEHAAGADHSERLWLLLNLEIWQRQFIDGEARVGQLPAATASKDAA
jgi:asparagine synthase (glutamine-hydrolysing)